MAIGEELPNRVRFLLTHPPDAIIILAVHEQSISILVLRKFISNANRDLIGLNLHSRESVAVCARLADSANFSLF